MARRARILIVDDDPGMRRTLSDIFLSKGYEPITASGGNTALQKAKKNQPTVALIDLRMEDISGIEVLQEINKLSPETASIVFTGYASRETAIKAVNLGAFSYIEKPYDIEQLLLHVQRAVEKKRAEKELRKRAHQQAAVARLGQIALEGGGLSSLMDETVNLVAEALEADYAEVYELLPHGNALLLRAGFGWKSGLVGRTKVAADKETLAGYTLGSPKPVMVEDFEAEKRFRPPSLLRQHNATSGMSVAIPGEGRPFGLLGAYTRRRQAFSDDEVHFLQAVSSLLATAIQRKQGEQALRQSQAQDSRGQRMLLALSQASQAVQRARTADEIYHTVGQELAKMGCQCTIFLLGEDRASLKIAHLTFEDRLIRKAEKLAGVSALGYQFPIRPGGFFQQIIQEGTTAYRQSALEAFSQEIPESLRPLANRIIKTLGIISSITSPLRVGNQVTGLLAVTSSDLRESDRQAMAAFANQMSIALENARLHMETMRRLREQTALLEAGSLISSTLELDSVLKLVAEQMAKAIDATSAYIYSFDTKKSAATLLTGYISPQAGPLERLSNLGAKYRENNKTFVQAMHAGRHEVIQLDDPHLPEADRSYLLKYGGKSALYIPLKVRGKLIGMAELYESRAPRNFTPEEIGLCQGIASHAASAMENARLFSAVRAGRERMQLLAHRLVEAHEEERRRIARELHDEFGQILTGLKLSLEMAHRTAPAEAREILGDADQQISDLLTKVRELSLDLRPAMIDDLGLLPTLLWHFERYTSQTGINVNFSHAGLEGHRLNPDLEIGCYRIVQEALTNVARHAVVRAVEVRISRRENVLRLEVKDQGVGFDPDGVLQARTSAGLAGMQERAAGLGGLLSISSAPGEGSRLVAELPTAGRLQRRKRQRSS